MKWVMFLIFTETSIVPLAEYSDGTKCIIASYEFQKDADDLRKSPNSGIYEYQCLPVPKTYQIPK